MRTIDGYLSATPLPSQVHKEDAWAARFHPDGTSDWRPPCAPEEDASKLFQVAQSFYTCSYCGSLHPQEVAAAIRQGAQVHWADFKYGWPHKLYVQNAPNRYAGYGEIRSPGTLCNRPPQAEIDAGKWLRFQDGFDSRTGEPAYSYRSLPLPVPTPASELTYGKFYSLHLQDAVEADRAVIEKACGLILTFTPGGRVSWKGLGDVQ